MKPRFNRMNSKTNQTFIKLGRILFALLMIKGLSSSWNSDAALCLGFCRDQGQELAESGGAGDLKEGKMVKTIDGTDRAVVSVQTFAGEIKVYNFEVENTHAYFVSGAGLLVHNQSALPGPGGKLSGAAKRKLGNMVNISDQTVAEAIRARGGSASNLQQLQTGMGQRSLGEVAEAAATGDAEAEKAIKMVKQAAQKGQDH